MIRTILPSLRMIFETTSPRRGREGKEASPGGIRKSQKNLPAIPVKTATNPEGQWKMFVDGAPNCGLLHDKVRTSMLEEEAVK